MKLKDFLATNTVYAEQYIGDGIYETQVVKTVDELGDSFREQTKVANTPADYYKVLIDDYGHLWALIRKEDHWDLRYAIF